MVLLTELNHTNEGGQVDNCTLLYARLLWYLCTIDCRDIGGSGNNKKSIQKEIYKRIVFFILKSS